MHVILKHNIQCTPQGCMLALMGMNDLFWATIHKLHSVGNLVSSGEKKYCIYRKTIAGSSKNISKNKK